MSAWPLAGFGLCLLSALALTVTAGVAVVNTLGIGLGLLLVMPLTFTVGIASGLLACWIAER